MKLPGVPTTAKLLLAALIVSAVATITVLPLFSDVYPLDGSPPQRGFAAVLTNVSDVETFIVFVLPQLLAFAVVSFVSMLVGARIIRNAAADRR